MRPMIRIGKIVATHGVNGALILKHVVGNSIWMHKDNILFIELRKDSYVPYFVKEARATGDEEYIVNVEDTDTVEAAKKLVGKQVYVKEDILQGKADSSPLLWIGFSMVDKKLGALGVIEDVMQTGAQWLAKIQVNNKEVLVPLVDELVLDVNIKNRFVRVELPDGLIELYTNI